MGKKDKLTIHVGDQIRVTRPKSVEHFLVGNQTTQGLVVAIDWDNIVGNHVRPYIVEFPDRPGQWSYKLWEIEKVEEE